MTQTHKLYGPTPSKGPQLNVTLGETKPLLQALSEHNGLNLSAQIRELINKEMLRLPVDDQIEIEKWAQQYKGDA